MKTKFIRDCLDYIETNIDDDLDLNHLSFKNNYSKFHFHRLFLNEMNVSLASYIRLRRVTRATAVLKLTNRRITDVALDLGFNSIDSFTRVFKDVFGLTPSEFRKTQQISNHVKEWRTMRDYFKEISLMTLNEKISCISAMDTILDLSEKAHKHGLFELEGNYGSKYLNKGIELLVDGVEPNVLRSILENYLKADSHSNVPVLERLIYLEGILMIQEGSYPWDIRRYLMSLFGEDMMEHLDDYYKSKLDYTLLCQNYLQHSLVAADNKKLVKELKTLNSRQIQRVIRECHKLALVVASYGFESDLKQVILDNMSSRVRENYLQLDSLLGEIISAHVVDATGEVLIVLEKLRVDGDI